MRDGTFLAIAAATVGTAFIALASLEMANPPIPAIRSCTQPCPWPPPVPASYFVLPVALLALGLTLASLGVFNLVRFRTARTV